ncbi:hypothetical protein X797_012144 [Metarhizium robertsii]|uniref:Acyltransferase 3 domain-containing protein n=1 Tax=Metarhizium robertsii TaxID=568076 RepID=A0A014P0P1_9HYPO|nr:hypothetical protein X797_012144 [Metarhizium robertsii]
MHVDRATRSKATAHLDGIRGFASLLVYWHHHELWFHNSLRKALEAAFGFNNEYYFVTLPGIRSFFTGGHFAVAMFFVVSGYTISIKCIKLIHTATFVELGDTVSSAFFRRWPRLFLLFIGTTIIYITGCHIIGIPVPRVLSSDSLRLDLSSWSNEFWTYSFVFAENTDRWFSFQDHLWTIPLELKGSYFVYTTLLVLSKCSASRRLYIEMLLLLYLLYLVDGWYFAKFIAGTMLAELDLLNSVDDLAPFWAGIQWTRRCFCHPLLVLSIYLAGVPHFDNLSAHNGWYHLSLLKPDSMSDGKWFYLFCSALLFVSSVRFISTLRQVFESRIMQYLEKLSFALYLVHGPILWIIGDRLYGLVEFLTHSELVPESKMAYQRNSLHKILDAGPVGLKVGFLMAQLLLLPLTLTVAELTRKFIDQPSVAVSQFIYQRIIDS